MILVDDFNLNSPSEIYIYVFHSSFVNRCHPKKLGPVFPVKQQWPGHKNRGFPRDRWMTGGTMETSMSPDQGKSSDLRARTSQRPGRTGLDRGREWQGQRQGVWGVMDHDNSTDFL